MLPILPTILSTKGLSMWYQPPPTLSLTYGGGVGCFVLQINKAALV